MLFGRHLIRTVDHMPVLLPRGETVDMFFHT